MGKWLRRILVPDAGWHFTWMGGDKAVALKGSSISVHSNLPEGEKSISWADTRMQTLMEDTASYELVEVDENFPQFIQEHSDVFVEYLLREEWKTPF